MMGRTWAEIAGEDDDCPRSVFLDGQFDAP
jgi:hypothetical protein